MGARAVNIGRQRTILSLFIGSWALIRKADLILCEPDLIDYAHMHLDNFDGVFVN